MGFHHGAKNPRPGKLRLNIGGSKREGGIIIAAPERLNLLRNDLANGRVMRGKRGW